MTDQLREALARLTPLVDPTNEWYSILDAARWKLEFPTDAQVEAAARAIEICISGNLADFELGVSEVRRKEARAALEAVK